MGHQPANERADPGRDRGCGRRIFCQAQIDKSNSMPKYVAFLRAINVGGRTVKMEELRRIFDAIGFSNVETFIASGNVIFDSKSKATRAIEQKIETALLKSLGYAVDTFVRAIPELTRIANH